MNQNTAPIHILAFFTLTAGDLSYDLPQIAVKSEQGDLDAALQDANQQMRDRYLPRGNPVDYALDEDHLPEWQRGFWHDGQHTIRLVGHSLINAALYEAKLLLDQADPH